MDLEIKLSELIEKGKENRRVLSLLKNAAVHAQSYELAAFIKSEETKSFPPSEDDNKKIKEAELFQMALKFSGIGEMSTKHAFVVLSATTLFKKKKGKFDTLDSSKIIAEANRLFYDE